ncbi:alpha/beta hydrolase [Sphingomonas sp. Tas61C01]|uniref:alpha/beta hydrolase n=1 Tax=Sphingomonas sp. Tas61C01 TaxID=3458297 RepID=UPI00403E8C06
MTLPWKIASSVLIGLCAIYLGALALLWWKQRSFIYPVPAVSGAAPVVDQGSHPVRLATEDGYHLHAIYRPARSGLPTIVFFHGNGDSLAGSQQATRVLAALGYGLLLPEYRGYGGNEGVPSETGLYRDGRATLLWLVSEGIPAEQTIVIGNSLGSGVATEIAATNHVGALILISGFTSMPDVVQAHLPYVPAHWLVLDRYENLRKISGVQAPVLILHGSEDTLITTKHAVSLAHARPGASLQLMPGYGHELAYTDKSQEQIARWLRRALR